MAKLLRYWERHGTRRPFPALYEAKRMYGANCINFAAPTFYAPNTCPWCGNTVTNKRRKYCCDTCAKKYQDKTVWQRGRDAYSLRILYRDNFTCQECGEFHAYVNEHGMTISIDDGELEVHHIKPVSDGGDDHPDNLRTLCHKCHVKIHKELKEKSMSKIKPELCKKLSKYDGHKFTKDDWIASGSSYCLNFYKGFDGDVICALSDDDNLTTYYLDGLNGIEFAESFTSENDIIHVYDDFLA